MRLPLPPEPTLRARRRRAGGGSRREAERRVLDRLGRSREACPFSCTLRALSWEERGTQTARRPLAAGPSTQPPRLPPDLRFRVRVSGLTLQEVPSSKA